MSSNIQIIKFLFKEPWKPLKEVEADSKDITMQEFSLASELSQFLLNNPSALILISLQDKKDLVELARFLKVNRKIPKSPTYKLAIVNFADDRQFDNALSTMGVHETIEPNVNKRALKFKMDLWLKSIQGQAKVTQQANVSQIAEKKSQNEAVNNGVPPQWEAPLSLKDDMWLLKKDSGCKKVLSKWIVKVLGPSPYVGQWNQSQPGLWVFEFKPKEKDAFQTGSGQWFFKSDQKPDFIWKENVWLLSGSAFELFYKDAATVVSRLKCKEKILSVAKNSESALSKKQAIIESLDKELVFSKDLDDKENGKVSSSDETRFKNLEGKGKTEHLNNENLSGEIDEQIGVNLNNLEGEINDKDERESTGLHGKTKVEELKDSKTRPDLKSLADELSTDESGQGQEADKLKKFWKNQNAHEQASSGDIGVEKTGLIQDEEKSKTTKPASLPKTSQVSNEEHLVKKEEETSHKAVENKKNIDVESTHREEKERELKKTALPSTKATTAPSKDKVQKDKIDLIKKSSTLSETKEANPEISKDKSGVSVQGKSVDGEPSNGNKPKPASAIARNSSDQKKPLQAEVEKKLKPELKGSEKPPLSSTQQKSKPIIPVVKKSDVDPPKDAAPIPGKGENPEKKTSLPQPKRATVPIVKKTEEERASKNGSGRPKGLQETPGEDPSGQSSTDKLQTHYGGKVEPLSDKKAVAKPLSASSTKKSEPKEKEAIKTESASATKEKQTKTESEKDEKSAALDYIQQNETSDSKENTPEEFQFELAAKKFSEGEDHPKRSNIEKSANAIAEGVDEKLEIAGDVSEKKVSPSSAANEATLSTLKKPELIDVGESQNNHAENSETALLAKLKKTVVITPTMAKSNQQTKNVAGTQTNLKLEQQLQSANVKDQSIGPPPVKNEVSNVPEKYDTEKKVSAKTDAEKLAPERIKRQEETPPSGLNTPLPFQIVTSKKDQLEKKMAAVKVTQELSGSVGQPKLRSQQLDLPQASSKLGSLPLGRALTPPGEGLVQSERKLSEQEQQLLQRENNLYASSIQVKPGTSFWIIQEGYTLECKLHDFNSGTLIFKAQESAFNGDGHQVKLKVIFIEEGKELVKSFESAIQSIEEDSKGLYLISIRINPDQVNAFKAVVGLYVTQSKTQFTSRRIKQG